MEDRKPVSVTQFLNKMKYNMMMRRSKYDPIGYADLVEEKMREKRAAEEYKKSLEEAQREREEKKAQELYSKIEKLIEKANEQRSRHPENFRPLYFPC
jgi:hypothetical protein